MNPQRLNLYYIFSQEAEKIAHNVRQHVGKHISLVYMVQSSYTAQCVLSTYNKISVFVGV